LRQAWPQIRFGGLTVATREGTHAFQAEVHLDALDPADVRVELYAEASRGIKPFRQTMTQIPGAPDAMLLYSARAPADRPAEHYTPRVVASHPDAILPLEAPYVLWQH
jgi:starch phosphorylase